MKILGIDPGTSGAAAIFDPDRTPASGLRWQVIDLPVIGESRKELSAASFRDWIRKYEPTHAFLEFVTAMPSVRTKGGERMRMGSMSAFQSGQMFGSLKTVLACCDVPYEFVTAQKWKKAYLLDKDKEHARARALRLFPDQASLLQRKKDQGRAESMLVANYGVMQLNWKARE